MNFMANFAGTKGIGGVAYAPNGADGLLMRYRKCVCCRLK